MGCVCTWRFLCECVCYYVELCQILLLVLCPSYRYGRQSTPEHNYLALQKSLCPQGKTEQRATVMFLAVGWGMQIGIVFLTTQMRGVADGSKTVKHLHKRKQFWWFVFQKETPSLSN